MQAIGDRRVRWMNLPANTGHQSGPNNAGLREARGRFIAYLGHDDLWLPHHLECLTSALHAGADSPTRSPRWSARKAAMRRWCRSRPGTGPAPGFRRAASCTAAASPIDAGGWRHFRDLDTDPERELWRRAYRRGCTFAFVPRLTAVKFPALWRRDAYRNASLPRTGGMARADSTRARLRGGRAGADPGRHRRLPARTRQADLAQACPYARRSRPIRKGGLYEIRRRYKGLDRGAEVARAVHPIAEDAPDAAGARKDAQLITSAWQKVDELIEGVHLREVLHVPRDHGVITELYRPEWDPTGCRSFTRTSRASIPARSAHGVATRGRSTGCSSIREA